jgi:hypothetical protein
MEFLSLDEKRFIACFVENCHAVLKPRHQNYISLYSYLDGTFESEGQQREQIKTNDVDLVDWLNLISYNVDNEHVYSHVMKSLEKCGYLASAIFRDRFEQVAGWLCLAESDEYRLKVRKELKARCKDSTPKSAAPRNVALPKVSKIASPDVSRNEVEDLFPKSVFNPDERNAILQVRRSTKQVFFPRKNFCSDFDKDVRFFAAFVAFQLQVNRYATIDDAAYYRALVFNEKERSAIQRWVELYQTIPESEVNPVSTQFQRKKLSPAEEKLSRQQFYERVKQAEESLRKKARERAIVSTSESPPDDWGRTRRSRLLDDGNSWREQK